MINIFMPPVRPPGARSEKEFTSLCIRCGKCLEACPHNSLKLSGGFGKGCLTPYVDLENNPCQLCMKCPPVCPTGALDPALKDLREVRMGQAYILKDKCHNFTDGIMCMTCYDRCPLRGEGVILDYGITPAMTSACIGCGICVYVCPQDAVVVVPNGCHLKPLNSLPLVSQP